MEESSNIKLISSLQFQLSVARSEIKNLRQEIMKLKHVHKTDVAKIDTLLNSFKCQNCLDSSQPVKCDCEFPNFKSIGKIDSWFSTKRGVPRQGVLCPESRGILTLFPSIINNPSYALHDLENFSHLWILYYFHKTDSNHIKTKVAPPKLNGLKVGIFSTRSPHRPCPIGLSIVKIEKICGNQIFFLGADMLNGTPVLDIKPYIPQYDNPLLNDLQSKIKLEKNMTDIGCELNSLREANTKESEIREAPDGEENNIRIPSWISNSAKKKLKVEFSKTGLSQFKEINQPEYLKTSIIKIIEEDPRSVYLKKKFGNQLYTFLVKNVLVTCKFDDINEAVIIYQIKQANQNCECGIPEWQCKEHAK